MPPHRALLRNVVKPIDYLLLGAPAIADAMHRSLADRAARSVVVLREQRMPSALPRLPQHHAERKLVSRAVFVFGLILIAANVLGFVGVGSNQCRCRSCLGAAAKCD